MKTLILAAVVAAMLAAAASDADAKGGHGSSHAGGHHAGTSHTAGGSHSGSAASHGRAAPGVHRDSHGRIVRSQKSKDDFKHAHPCPSTGKSSGACPGYVIDHVVPLKRGGADHPSNMQWQTREAARQKDRTE